MKDLPSQTQPELSLLIPTYNEAEIIIDTLKKIEAALPAELVRRTEIFIVDDGKDDLPQTVTKHASTLNFHAIKVLRNSPPLGKGKSLARGFAAAQGTVVGFLDADLSTPASYINLAYQTLKTNQADIFIGSRKLKDSVVTRQQFFLKDWMGGILSGSINRVLFFGMRYYHDTQCGFKFFKNHVAKRLYKNLVTPDGLTDIEILLRSNLLDYRVVEKGVIWTDLRESKRSLRRILAGELTSMAKLMLHYKFKKPEV